MKTFLTSGQVEQGFINAIQAFIEPTTPHNGALSVFFVSGKLVIYRITNKLNFNDSEIPLKARFVTVEAD